LYINIPFCILITDNVAVADVSNQNMFHEGDSNDKDDDDDEEDDGENEDDSSSSDDDSWPKVVHIYFTLFCYRKDVNCSK